MGQTVSSGVGGLLGSRTRRRNIGRWIWRPSLSSSAVEKGNTPAAPAHIGREGSMVRHNNI